jgi:hypothetical protein
MAALDDVLATEDVVEPMDLASAERRFIKAIEQTNDVI